MEGFQSRDGKTRCSRTALAVLCGAMLLGLIVPASGSAARLFWGAQIGTQLTGTQAPFDIAPMERFQHIAGKGLSLIGFNSPFANCAASPCQPYIFPTPAMENARSYGAIPFLSWGSASSPETLDEPSYQLSDIAAGRHDAYIRKFAIAAREWGHPFFLRFNWEMNGSWFSWAEGVNGNGAGDYVAAWRHVHDIFASVGARNATWVWCPNVNLLGDLSRLGPLYPGDRYVNWTCLDGFNWGSRHDSVGWLNFKQIFGKTYQQVVHLAPSKPMIIGETASTNVGGDKASWIRNMLRQVRTRYRKIRGLIWFDVNDRGTHWPIESGSRRVRRAFRQGIAHPAYRPNVYGNLPFGPVRPPR